MAESDKEWPFPTKITHARLAQQAMYLSSNIASWGASYLMVIEMLDKPVTKYDVERFLANARAKLDMIEEWSKNG